MAHSDYDCCVVCDSKLAYNSGDATTKERFCPDCAFDLRDAGFKGRTPGHFIQWVQSQDVSTLRAKLEDLGFSYCIFHNPVDEAVKAILEPVNPPAW